MFIVTKTTNDGTEKPVIFVRKEDALRYKRNLVLSSAYLSMYGEDFAKTLDTNKIKQFNTLLDYIGVNFYTSSFDEDDVKLLAAFEIFLRVEKDCSLYDEADYIYYGDKSYLSVQLFDVPAPCDIQTSAGMATAVAYNDGCAKGVQIWLDDDIVCALDVYEKEFDAQECGGEARVLAYKKEYAENEEEAPIACITINR